MREIFLKYSIEKLLELASRIDYCLERLDDEQVWARGSEAENSAGNLVLHLCGNVRQWIISGVGSQPDVRDRDAEFAARGGVQMADLRQRLKSTLDEAAAVIRPLTEESLMEEVSIQGYQVTRFEAIYHVVEHFSMHTGQILFITKLVNQEDLGFYGHLNKKELRASR